MKGCSISKIWSVCRFCAFCCFACWVGDACRTPVDLNVPVPSTQWEVLFRPATSSVFGMSAAPDGAIFAGGDGRVYRALPDDNYKTWNLIADEAIRLVDVFAFSRSSIAVRTARNVIFLIETNSGWHVLATAIPDSVLQTPQGRALLFDLWGRSSSDVFAVGNLGTILHFDGQEWKRESNPIEALPMSDTTLSRTYIGGVGGTELRTFAAGEISLERVGGTWHPIDRAEAHLGGCKSRAISASHVTNNGQSQVLFGGGEVLTIAPCLWSMTSGSLRLQTAQAHVGDALIHGKAQQDGSSLFWTYGGDVVEAVENQISHIYHLRKFDDFGGAVAVGGYLYFGGQAPAPVIARIPRR